jgi:glycolate oxidase
MANSTRYNPVTSPIADELRQIVGEKYVIYADAEKLETYSHDEVANREWAHMPEAVVRPQTTQEVAAIMKLANNHRIPVTPRGAGSGLSGGAVPLHGGIVLLVDRMSRIVEIDRENMMVTVEPGVVTNEINEALKPYDLFYAGYPMSLETCYIGGNVAENAGGGKAVKYGVTARYVLGLEVVTPTGEVVEMGGKLIKDVSGYNMVQLMVGSEGTLGIFTKIVLKLMPLPKATVDLLCIFRTPDDAIKAVPMIMTSGGIIPTAIEFMDRPSVMRACEYLNETFAYKEAGAMLLITVDGNSEQQVQQEYETIGEMCLSAGAIEVYVADNATTSERIWKIRRNISEAWTIYSRRQSSEDLVVPPASIPRMIEMCQELERKYGVTVASFGHAGDGNLHTRIMADPSWTDEYWKGLLPKILTEVYALTASLGGRISGEHGIGHKRKKYLPLVVSESYIDMLRAVKKALDPNNILNPGKIFDI